VQSDSQIIAGGYVMNGGYPYFMLTRVNSDGTRDNNFNASPSGVEVLAVALQSDGKVLVGSSLYDGASGPGIVRVNSTGTADNSFNVGSGVDGAVKSIAVQSNGKILIGGVFTTVNHVARNGIARLNADGSLDDSFNVGSGANGDVRSIAMQTDGNVVIAGSFTTVNGIVRPNVVRLFGDPSVLPPLSITKVNASIVVSWPVSSFDVRLLESANLAVTGAWSTAAQPLTTNGNEVSVTLAPSAPAKFFRLAVQ
jgi:uncharacterized delta-60 repeat protein